MPRKKRGAGGEIPDLAIDGKNFLPAKVRCFMGNRHLEKLRALVLKAASRELNGLYFVPYSDILKNTYPWIRYTPRNGWWFPGPYNEIRTADFPESFKGEIGLYTNTYDDFPDQKMLIGIWGLLDVKSISKAFRKECYWIIPSKEISYSTLKNFSNMTVPINKWELLEVVTHTNLIRTQEKHPFIATFGKGNNRVSFWVKNITEALVLEEVYPQFWKNTRTGEVVVPNVQAQREADYIDAHIELSVNEAEGRNRKRLQLDWRRKGERFLWNPNIPPYKEYTKEGHHPKIFAKREATGEGAEPVPFESFVGWMPFFGDNEKKWFFWLNSQSKRNFGGKALCVEKEAVGWDGTDATFLRGESTGDYWFTGLSNLWYTKGLKEGFGARAAFLEAADFPFSFDNVNDRPLGKNSKAVGFFHDGNSAFIVWEREGGSLGLERTVLSERLGLSEAQHKAKFGSLENPYTIKRIEEKVRSQMAKGFAL